LVQGSMNKKRNFFRERSWKNVKLPAGVPTEAMTGRGKERNVNDGKKKEGARCRDRIRESYSLGVERLISLS